MPRQRLWVRKLVIYGATNSGRDFSLDAQLLDQEAVVDHLGLDRFNLLGAAEAGQVAITYAFATMLVEVQPGTYETT